MIGPDLGSTSAPTTSIRPHHRTIGGGERHHDCGYISNERSPVIPASSTMPAPRVDRASPVATPDTGSAAFP